MKRATDKTGGGKAARLFASLAVAGLIVAVIFVVNSFRTGPEPPRRAFDPTTTDPSELRRVTEAVSRVIEAPPSQHRAAVETLETLSVRSAGALDLKESCVNTYRGELEASADTAQLRAILESPDGGMRITIPAGERIRAEQIERHAREQLELAHQSHDRCMDLYTAAVRTMGIRPARRPDLR